MPQSQQNQENQDSWDRFLAARKIASGIDHDGKRTATPFEKNAYPVGFGLIFAFIGALIGGIFIVIFFIIGIFVGRVALKNRYKKSQNPWM